MLSNWPSVLLATLLSLSYANAFLIPFSSPYQDSQHVPNSLRQTHEGSWMRKARETLIESIWSVSAETAPTTTKSYHQTDPPQQLLARYGGDVVLRFTISSAEEAQALKEAVQTLFLDVWEFTSEWSDIRISKDVVPSLLGLLPPSMQHAHTPLMLDLAQSIFESYPSPGFREASPRVEPGSRPFNPSIRTKFDETNVFFRQYQPLSVILPWMRLLRSLFPTHVRLINIGLSYEGREIQALRVGVHPTNREKPSERRKTIIISGGSHAREWISTSTVNYVAYSFITSYGRDKDITRLLQLFDFVFVPTLNPDGYVYTFETDRLWRKNRQQTTLRFCKGLDLDRSYGFQWESDPEKNSPCSESFSGETPFEAIEARRFADWAKNQTLNNSVDIVGFLDLHSYSQQVLYPYSFSCTSAPPSLENLEELAMGLAKAIRTTTGELYAVTSACEGSVPVKCKDGSSSSARRADAKSAIWPRMESGGGSALDWFYHELNVPYAYQLKLRDTGSYGFLLPSENIVPTGKEAFKAVEYLGKFLSGNKGIEDERNGIHDEALLTHSEEHEQPEEDDWVVLEEQNNQEDNTELRKRR